MSLLEDIYGGTMELNEHNILQVLQYADRLQLKNLITRCIQFLKMRLKFSNCIGVWQVGKRLWYPDLNDGALQYIKENFERVALRSDEFTEVLTHEEVYMLLCCDELRVSSEVKVLMSILRWVSHKESERKEHIDLLMTTIRYFHVRSEEINVKELYSKYPEPFHSLILKFLGDVATAKLQGGVGLPARTPWQVGLVFGGWSGRNPVKSIQMYNPVTQRWTIMPEELPEHRIYYCAEELDGIIYIMGGFDNQQPRGLRSVWAFDVANMVWQMRCNMGEPRCYAASAIHGGKVYMLGGYNEPSQERFKSCERFDPLTNEWERIEDMQLVRSDGAAVTLHNMVYAIGGFTGAHIHDSVEAYNPEKRTWQLVPKMLNARSGVSASVHHNFIYAVGGYDGHKQLNSIERYTPEQGAWHIISRMTMARSNMGVTPFCSSILITGGYGNDYTTQLCEELCLDKDSEDEVQPGSSNKNHIRENWQIRQRSNLLFPEGCSGIKLIAVSGFEITHRLIHA